MPPARPQDAHDIIGTYRLLADRVELSIVPSNEDEFIELLKRRHRRIKEGRAETLPGQLKEVANRAGGTVFVDPELVAGTLAAGWRLRAHLDTPWERAVYTAFVIAEVRPFNDGNGRVARATMASELDAGSQSRIIIPTVFRDDYLDGLRLLSRQNQPAAYTKAMRYAHDFTASIDYADFAGMKEQLEAANAFEDPSSPDRLRVLRRSEPDPTHTAPWRVEQPRQ